MSQEKNISNYGFKLFTLELKNNWRFATNIFFLLNLSLFHIL
jgi:hypothetical protein